MPRIFAGCDTARRMSEESVDERRNRRTLRQHQQHSENYQSDNYRREPILFVLLHELPEFADYLSFRHLNSKHLFIVPGIFLPLGIRSPVTLTGGGASIQRIPSEQA